MIYDQMASGGTARVHLARRIGPEKFSRIVVMKGLKPVFAVDAELRAMLRDEAWLAARISHPNVVPVIDVEADGDEFWLALEYVHGETLTGLMRKLNGSPVPTSIAASIFVGVLHGLHAAHELCDEHGEPLGLVHRDVSPQNIIVGVDGVARVLDFGIAKALGRSQATRDGEVKGKVAYMAPEQIFGEPVSRRTDIFATSIVLWEALTGRRLFLGETESETIVRVGNMKIPAPSECAEVPPALDAVVLRGLKREANERFATARDMAVAIEGAVELASATQVGAWVENLAAETLTRRKAMIQRIEREAPQTGDTSVRPISIAPIAPPRSNPPPAAVVESSVPEPTERRRRPSWVALSLVFLFALVAALYVRLQRTQAPVQPAIIVQAAPEEPVRVEPAPEPPVAPPTTVKPPEPREEPAAEAPSPEGPARERKKTRTASARAADDEAPAPKRVRAQKPADDCDPPYQIDAQGHKRFKVQCL